MNDGFKYRQPYHMGVGAASIIMIFVVLCLTALGILGLARARASAKTTERRTEYVCGYYAAEAEAQHWIARASDEAGAGALAEGAQLSERFEFLSDRALEVKLSVLKGGKIKVDAHVVINTNEDLSAGGVIID